MDRARALDRIRKCLRLAASDNPHEAAAAPSREAVTRWLAAQGERTERVQVRPRGRLDAAGAAAAARGHAAGQRADLHHGVGAGPARRQIGHESERRKP